MDYNNNYCGTMIQNLKEREHVATRDSIFCFIQNRSQNRFGYKSVHQKTAWCVNPGAFLWLCLYPCRFSKQARHAYMGKPALDRCLRPDPFLLQLHQLGRC